MTSEQIGMLLSLAAMVVTVYSFQIKHKAPLMVAQSIGSILFLVSYIFSGGGFAIYLNIIFLIRNTLFMFIDCSVGRLKYYVGGALLVSYVVTFIAYTAIAAEPWSVAAWYILPLLAATFGTIGTMFSNVNVYRAWKYGDSICWFSFNLHIGIGALGGIVGEILTFISLTVGIIRYRKK